MLSLFPPKKHSSLVESNTMATEKYNGKNSGKDDEPPVPWAWIRAVNEIVVNEPWLPVDGKLPVQLAPWLWLSDQRSVMDAAAMYDMGATHVVSTNSMPTHELRNLKTSLQRVNIRHFYVAGHDEPHYDMIGKHWETCRDFLQGAREESPDCKIVIHCVAGTNRSATIATAALLCLPRADDADGPRQPKQQLLDVVRYIKGRRGMVLTNLCFQRQLCQLAAKHGLLGDSPSGFSNDPLPIPAPPTDYSDALNRLF